jgi:hypothetical protein
MKLLEGLLVLFLLIMSVLLGGLGSSADAAVLCANPGGQTGPKDCLPQYGNKRLYQLGVIPFISIPGSHMLEAPFYLYAAWLLIESRHAGDSRLFPHWLSW